MLCTGTICFFLISSAGFIARLGNLCPGLPSIRVGAKPNTTYCMRLMAAVKPLMKNAPSYTTANFKSWPGGFTGFFNQPDLIPSIPAQPML